MTVHAQTKESVVVTWVVSSVNTTQHREGGREGVEAATNMISIMYPCIHVCRSHRWIVDRVWLYVAKWRCECSVFFHFSFSLSVSHVTCLRRVYSTRTNGSLGNDNRRIAFKSVHTTTCANDHIDQWTPLFEQSSLSACAALETKTLELLGAYPVHRTASTTNTKSRMSEPYASGFEPSVTLCRLFQFSPEEKNFIQTVKLIAAHSSNRNLQCCPAPSTLVVTEYTREPPTREQIPCALHFEIRGGEEERLSGYLKYLFERQKTAVAIADGIKFYIRPPDTAASNTLICHHKGMPMGAAGPALSSKKRSHEMAAGDEPGKRPRLAGGALGFPVTLERSFYRKNGLTDKNMWSHRFAQVNPVLQEMFATSKVKTKAGDLIKFHAGVNPKEGFYLYSCVKDNKYRNCLEVGCAYGTSANYMCQGFKDGGQAAQGPCQLVSIDPFQSTQWEGIGRLNVQRAGLGEFHHVFEAKDFVAMPKLLEEVEQGRRQKFDLIFIDGMHLFDYTLLDFFYADKLLRANGLIVVDDIKHKCVAKFYDYVLTNYNFCYEEIKTPCSETSATFRKIKDEEIDTPGNRSWHTHVEF